VTNCVTIEIFSGGASLPLGPSRRFTVVVVCGCGCGYRGLAHDRDAKLATLIHPVRPRNHQVRALHIDKRRREPTALP
jgi:hypothetical protein